MSLLMLSECSTPELYPWDPCASLKFSKDMPLIMDSIKLEFPIIIDKSVKGHEVLPDLWCWWWVRMSEAALPGPPKFRANSPDSPEASSPRSGELSWWGAHKGQKQFLGAQATEVSFPMAHGGNTGHRHQHRPRLLLDHRPRYGPLPKLRPGYHDGSEWLHRPLWSVWPQQQHGPQTPRCP